MNARLLPVSGHPSLSEGHELQGKVGRDVTAEQAQEASRWIAIDLLSTVRNALGDLDRVHHIVKLFGLVNSVENFTGQSQVINGASDFLLEAFGERGKHARSAIGVAQLPKNASVEIEMILEIIA